MKKGSSVLENRNVGGASGSLRMIQQPQAECYGEAAVVELGDGKQFFAVREDAYVARRMYDMVTRMLAYPSAELQPPLPSHPSRGAWAVAYPEARKMKPRAQIHRKDFPLLVTLADSRDPTTIQEVDPDNLAATFGPGCRLDGITVEVTDDPMTDGIIVRHLPWLTPLDQPLPVKNINKAADPAADLGKHAFRYMGLRSAI